jgi:hypothetical protein
MDTIIVRAHALGQSVPVTFLQKYNLFSIVRRIKSPIRTRTRRTHTHICASRYRAAYKGGARVKCLPPQQNHIGFEAHSNSFLIGARGTFADHAVHLVTRIKLRAIFLCGG